MEVVANMDYSGYKPLILDSISIERLKSDEYHRFIMKSVIEPGVRLIVHRKQMHPDYPFVDTKFNPATGEDLPESAYDVVYSWFLGRGSEALAVHIPVIDSLDGMTGDEKHLARSVLTGIVWNMTPAITAMMEKNGGICPFRVNRFLTPIDAEGREITLKTGTRTLGNMFCMKGLAAGGPPENVERARAMIEDLLPYVRENRIGGDQAPVEPGKLSHAARMIMIGALALALQKTSDAGIRKQLADTAEEFIIHILDHHYNRETAVFSEFVDETTGRAFEHLDPGHANEFVGLSLWALEEMQAGTGTAGNSRHALVDRCRRELPRLLLKSTELGWNHEQHGMHKAVDNTTGEPINDDMPWWNLPETMRAAIRSYEIADDTSIRDRCLEAIRLCHNAYFEHYLNRNFRLFPFQTRSGRTGKVVDRVPAVPEGDPLYHANVSLLDFLSTARRM